jgi:hypothetical protein
MTRKPQSYPFFQKRSVNRFKNSDTVSLAIQMLVVY